MHLLDANVLITADAQYYPLAAVPEYWDWLRHVGEQGLVKLPQEIYEEIARGDDELAAWITEASVRNALLLNEDVDMALVQVVLGRYATDLNDAEMITVGMDPFLIAYAAYDIKSRIVVTGEVSKPTKTRANRHIPDVCAELGIRCCNNFEMAKALNFTTRWNTGV